MCEITCANTKKSCTLNLLETFNTGFLNNSVLDSISKYINYKFNLTY